MKIIAVASYGWHKTGPLMPLIGIVKLPTGISSALRPTGNLLATRNVKFPEAPLMA